MNKIFPVLLAMLASSCAVHKIEAQRVQLESNDLASTVEVKKQNKWVEGNHCKEPLFYVLTLGLVPTHCVDTYMVSNSSENIGTVKITTMQGWLTPLIAPFPSWQLGQVKEPESTIKNLVQETE